MHRSTLIAVMVPFVDSLRARLVSLVEVSYSGRAQLDSWGRMDSTGTLKRRKHAEALHLVKNGSVIDANNDFALAA